MLSASSPTPLEASPSAGRRGWGGSLAALALFAVSTATALAVIRPDLVGQVGYDSAASVIYWDRIVAGQRMEAFVTATPKPWLTVLYGVLYGLTHDWRAINVATILAFGLAVTLGAVLAWRVAGPIAAGFAALGLLGSATLFNDMADSYAVAWALLGWLVAGLALSRPRPRYAVAGIALALGGMARLESVIVPGLALLVLVALAIRARWWGAAPPPRGAWLVLIGLAAVPVQAIHDLLLTGDPLFSSKVPVIGSTGMRISLLGVGHQIFNHYRPFLALIILALIGAVALLLRRRWAMAIGLAAIGPGIGAFLLFLGARGIYVSYRYTIPIDLALVMSAAVGAAWLRVEWLAAFASRLQGWLRPATGIAVGAVLALAIAGPFAPLDPAVRASIALRRNVYADAEQVRPVLAGALSAEPGAFAMPSHPDPYTGKSDGPPAVVVPVLLRPRFVVELGLPLSQVAGISATGLGTDGTNPAPGQLIYHDRLYDRPGNGYGLIEADQTVQVGQIRIELLYRKAPSVWVVRIRPAS